MMGRADRHALLLAALLLMLAPRGLQAADSEQQTVWGGWFSSLAIGEDWTLVSDIQVRGADDAERLRNGLLRAGLSRQLTPGFSVAGGLALITSNEPGTPTRIEHRLWQQLVFQHRMMDAPLTHRLRLEQRFIEAGNGDRFESDRLRYFLRWQRALQPGANGRFSGGPYLALQNEVFLHLSHRQRLNGQTFDQNRAYAGLGYRLKPHVDLEVGYLHQAAAGSAIDLQNHVLQLSLHTRF